MQGYRWAWAVAAGVALGLGCGGEAVGVGSPSEPDGETTTEPIADGSAGTTEAEAIDAGRDANEDTSPAEAVDARADDARTAPDAEEHDATFGRDGATPTDAALDSGEHDAAPTRDAPPQDTGSITDSGGFAPDVGHAEDTGTFELDSGERLGDSGSDVTIHESDSGTEGLDAGFHPDGTVDTGSGSTGPDAGCACGLPVGSLYPTPTQADFVSIFSRTWLSCGQPSITGMANEAGFVATAAGTYTILLYDATGSVTNGPQGTYTVEANQPGTWQVNLSYAFGPPLDAGTQAFYLFLATVTEGPEMLVFDNEGTSQYRYLPASPWASDAGVSCAVPEAGVYTPPAACSATPSGTMPVPTQAALDTLLEQTWLLCTSDGVGETSPSQAGLVMHADGTYNVLEVDGSGQLVAATDIHNAGTWSVPLVASNYFQLNFQPGSPGTYILEATLSQSPFELLLNNNGVYDYRYIPMTGDAGP